MCTLEQGYFTSTQSNAGLTYMHEQQIKCLLHQVGRLITAGKAEAVKGERFVYTSTQG